MNTIPLFIKERCASFGLAPFCSLFSSPCYCLVLWSSGSAQENTQPWNANHFSVPAKDLYQAASTGITADGANIVLFDDDESFSFDEAGRLTHVGHYIYKVLTSKGAEGWDSLSVGWDAWHEMRPVIRARVIGSDYSEHNFDPRAITKNRRAAATTRHTATAKGCGRPCRRSRRELS